MRPYSFMLCCLSITGFSSCNTGKSDAGTTSQKEDKTRKPNVVIMLTDDQGYFDMHCYGNQNMVTPNLDRLASEGIRMTNYYSGAPSSTPSRAALLTGRYAERVGIPFVVDDLSDNGLKTSEFTIADYLKQNDYATGIFGKWHLGCKPEHLPIQHGFKEFFGIPYSNDMWPFHPQPTHAYRALPLYDNDKIIEYNPTVNQMTTRITERAVQFIEHHKDEQFFLYVPYTQPHVPLGVSGKFKDKSGEGLYADVIEEIDWSVGQIMETLRKYNLEQNTLVIFTSDNGPWLSYGNHGGSTGGLREGKGTTFEGGQRVPFIARMTGKIPAGIVSDQFMSALDIAPTVLALTDTHMPRMNAFDGEDVWPTLTGGKQEHAPFFFIDNGHVEAVRDGQWKCVTAHKYRIVPTPGKDGMPGVQLQNGGEIGLSLFNLTEDPNETSNVADQHPEITERLKRMIDRMQEDVDEWIKDVRP